MIVITTIDALPDRCYECPCRDGESGYCQADKERRCSDYRPYWCPLKEINVKHSKEALDREKIIKGLEALQDAMSKNQCYTCSHEFIDAVDEFGSNIICDAIALLKDREAIKPTINEYGEAYCICGENVGIIPRSKNLPSICSKYCSECRRRMKWE